MLSSGFILLDVDGVRRDFDRFLFLVQAIDDVLLPLAVIELREVVFVARNHEQVLREIEQLFVLFVRRVFVRLDQQAVARIQLEIWRFVVNLRRNN